MMAPPGVERVLDDPKLSADLEAALREVPFRDTADGYWAARRPAAPTVLAKRRTARLGDALIAQNCLDHRLPLLTRDRDFMAFARDVGP